MKAFAWILTSAAILIGADVVMSSEAAAQTAVATAIEQPLALHGGTGIPPLPPDAF